jgi:hypothetical protein
MLNYRESLETIKGIPTTIYRPDHRNPYKAIIISNGIQRATLWEWSIAEEKKRLHTALRCAPLSPYLRTRIPVVDLS